MKTKNFQIFSPEMRKLTKKFMRIFLFYVLVYLSVVPILLFTALVFVWRTVLSSFYKYYYEGKYKLPESLDSAFAVESHANTLTMTSFVFVRGQIDISKLRQLFHEKVLQYDKINSDMKPYQKMTWKLIRKYGFFTWEETGDRFNIKDHVKLCPNLLDKVYTEDEVHGAIEALADNTFDPGRPQWEILLVPKVKLREGGEIHYALVWRIYHAYMDGLSVAQMFRNLIDTKVNFAIDPLKPIGRPPSLLQIAGLYSQVFLFSPFVLYKVFKLQNSKNNAKNIHKVEMVENKGPKFFCRTKSDISLETLKIVRKVFSCNTTAIFNSAIVGAIHKTAARKDVQLPKKFNLSFTLAMFPYPHDGPQNKFVITCLPSPSNKGDDPRKRLEEMNKIVKSVQMYEVFTLYLVEKLLGYLPIRINEYVIKGMHSFYAISNLPCFTERIHLNGGNPVEDIYGCPPIKNGLQFGIGIASYMSNLRACWLIEKSSLISTKDDAERLLDDFEAEIATLGKLANANVNTN